MAAWKGSVESDGAEQEHFPVAAQGRALPRERLTIHICSHHFCFMAPFSELPSQDFCHLFSHLQSYLLTVSILHAVGAVRERGLGIRGGGLQTPSKWLQQRQGLLATTLASSWHCPGGQDRRVPAPCWLSVAPGPSWDTTGAGVDPVPPTAPVAAACCRGTELRSWRQ